MPTKTRLILKSIVVLWLISCMAVAEPLTTPTTQPPTQTPAPTQDIILPASPTSTISALPTEPQPTPSTGSFELIGHSPLLQRGMNAGLAVYGNYAYVGSRTDGTHSDAGVLVIDISNPSNPQIVFQIGPPDEGIVGQTSRELRVWQDQEMLLVLNFACELGLHDCAQASEPPNISFYDISGVNAAAPKLINKYVLPRTPHEMFLWDDPNVTGRSPLRIDTGNHRR